MSISPPTSRPQSGLSSPRSAHGSARGSGPVSYASGPTWTRPASAGKSRPRSPLGSPRPATTWLEDQAMSSPRSPSLQDTTRDNDRFCYNGHSHSRFHHGQMQGQCQQWPSELQLYDEQRHYHSQHQAPWQNWQHQENSQQHLWQQQQRQLQPQTPWQVQYLQQQGSHQQLGECSESYGSEAAVAESVHSPKQCMEHETLQPHRQQHNMAQQMGANANSSSSRAGTVEAVHVGSSDGAPPWGSFQSEPHRQLGVGGFSRATSMESNRPPERFSKHITQQAQWQQESMNEQAGGSSGSGAAAIQEVRTTARVQEQQIHSREVHLNQQVQQQSQCQQQLGDSGWRSCNSRAATKESDTSFSQPLTDQMQQYNSGAGTKESYQMQQHNSGAGTDESVASLRQPLTGQMQQQLHCQLHTYQVEDIGNTGNSEAARHQLAISRECLLTDQMQQLQCQQQHMCQHVGDNDSTSRSRSPTKESASHRLAGRCSSGGSGNCMDVQQQIHGESTDGACSYELDGDICTSRESCPPEQDMRQQIGGTNSGCISEATILNAASAAAPANSQQGASPEDVPEHKRRQAEEGRSTFQEHDDRMQRQQELQHRLEKHLQHALQGQQTIQDPSNPFELDECESPEQDAESRWSSTPTCAAQIQSPASESSATFKQQFSFGPCMSPYSRHAHNAEVDAETQKILDPELDHPEVHSHIDDSESREWYFEDDREEVTAEEVHEELGEEDAIMQSAPDDHDSFAARGGATSASPPMALATPGTGGLDDSPAPQPAKDGGRHASSLSSTSPSKTVDAEAQRNSLLPHGDSGATPLHHVKRPMSAPGRGKYQAVGSGRTPIARHFRHRSANDMIHAQQTALLDEEARRLGSTERKHAKRPQSAYAYANAPTNFPTVSDTRNNSERPWWDGRLNTAAKSDVKGRGPSAATEGMLPPCVRAQDATRVQGSEQRKAGGAVSAPSAARAVRADGAELSKELQSAYERIRMLEAELAKTAENVLNYEHTLRHEKYESALKANEQKKAVKELQDNYRMSAEEEKRVSSQFGELHQEVTKLQGEKMSAERELTTAKRRAEELQQEVNEVNVFRSQREEVHRSLARQVQEKDAQADVLRMEKAELQSRVDFLEASMRRHQALAFGRALPGGGESMQLQELRAQHEVEVSNLTGQLRDFQMQDERKSLRLAEVDADNRQLRQHRQQLQDTLDQATEKIRSFDDVQAERHALISEVASLREQLCAASRFASDREAEAHLALEKLAAKLDKEILSVGGDAFNEWLAPVTRRAEEAEYLLDQTRNELAVSMKNTEDARSERDLAQLRLSAVSQEAERLQRQIFEARTNLDMSVAEGTAFMKQLKEAEVAAELGLERLRKQLTEEKLAAIQDVRAEAAKKVEQLELEQAQRDEELRSLSRLQAVVSHIESIGGLGELEESLATLRSISTSGTALPSMAPSSEQHQQLVPQRPGQSPPAQPRPHMQQPMLRHTQQQPMLPEQSQVPHAHQSQRKPQHAPQQRPIRQDQSLQQALYAKAASNCAGPAPARRLQSASLTGRQPPMLGTEKPVRPMTC